MKHRSLSRSLLGVFALLTGPATRAEPPMPVAIHGETIHTMAGVPIKDGLILVRDGRIT